MDIEITNTGTEVVANIPVSIDQANAIGADLAPMHDNYGDTLTGLAHLRMGTGRKSTYAATITATTRLIDDATAIRHGAVRAHKAAGGTNSELAEAAGIPNGTASNWIVKSRDLDGTRAAWVSGEQPARMPADRIAANRRDLADAIAVGDWKIARELITVLIAGGVRDIAELATPQDLTGPDAEARNAMLTAVEYMLGRQESTLTTTRKKEIMSSAPKADLADLAQLTVDLYAGMTSQYRSGGSSADSRMIAAMRTAQRILGRGITE